MKVRLFVALLIVWVSLFFAAAVNARSLYDWAFIVVFIGTAILIGIRKLQQTQWFTPVLLEHASVRRAAWAAAIAMASVICLFAFVQFWTYTRL